MTSALDGPAFPTTHPATSASPADSAICLQRLAVSDESNRAVSYQIGGTPLLAEGERSVGELAAVLAEPQPKVSNHLACLRWCGFVRTRREHRTIYYRLADERVVALVDLAHALLRENAEHVAACRRVDREGC